MVAALVDFAQSQRQAAGRPGGCGRAFAKPSLEEVDDVCKTYKSIVGLGHDCINPKAILELQVELRVRFVDLLVAFEAKLVKPLCWSEAQAIRRSPHIWPHRCPVASAVATAEAAGAKVGERPRCGLLLGLPRESVRLCRLGALDHGGGSEGAAAVGGFLVIGPGQILRARRARPPLGRRSENQFSNATLGLLVRFLRRWRS